MQLTVDEQEALARALSAWARRPARVGLWMRVPSWTFSAWLTRLPNPHGVPLRAGEPLPVIRELTYVVYPDPESGAYPSPLLNCGSCPTW